MKLYRVIASTLQARRNCAESKNVEWEERHTARILALVKAHMPSGGGIDLGTEIDLDASTYKRLVFHTHFHHMSETGFYDGWTDHTVRVDPSLSGEFDLRISGPNRNAIKDYLHEVFADALRVDVDQSHAGRVESNVEASV